MIMSKAQWELCIWAPSISLQSNWIQLSRKNVLALALYICGPYLLACSKKNSHCFHLVCLFKYNVSQRCESKYNVC